MICSRGSRKRCFKGLTWRADPLLFLNIEIYAALPALVIHGILLFAGAALVRGRQRCLWSIQSCLPTSGNETGGQCEGQTSVRTGQKNDRIEGKISADPSWLGTVQSGDATSQMGEIRRDLLLEYGVRGCTRRWKDTAEEILGLTTVAGKHS